MTFVDPTPLVLDGNERSFDYPGSPRFYAFLVHGVEGTPVDLYAEARSPAGTAGIWLTDANFQNLAVSSDGSKRAHLSCVFPSGGTFYVVVRDGSLRPGPFAVWGTGADPDENAPCHGVCGGGGGDAGASRPGSLVCEAHRWLRPVPAAGWSMMAYGGKGYLFAPEGKSWTIVENESALSQAIPLPPGIAAMRSVKAEIAPSGRPLVTFVVDQDLYAAFFDGHAFVRTTNVGQAATAHADAAERIYADTSNGIVEFAPGAQPLYRGALPKAQGASPGWTVDAKGTIHRLYTRSGGDAESGLWNTKLAHGSMTWGGDTRVASSAGFGWGSAGLPFTAAPDGSLHFAYALRYEAYYFRSRDGVSWSSETYKDILSKAKMVDPEKPIFDDDPAEVGGSIRLLAAQDYDHASITMVTAGGSLGTSSFYHLRRCPPFVGLHSTWPADRLAFSGLAYDHGTLAVDERGLATLLTPAGVRQDTIHAP